MQKENYPIAFLLLSCLRVVRSIHDFGLTWDCRWELAIPCARGESDRRYPLYWLIMREYWYDDYSGFGVVPWLLFRRKNTRNLSNILGLSEQVETARSVINIREHALGLEPFGVTQMDVMTLNPTIILLFRRR